ncbi:hypothetical protein ACLM5H_08625 [Fredinandcohnia humi]
MSEQQLEPFLDFFLYEQGVSVEVNGNIQKGLISNSNESIRYYNDKYLIGKFELHTGDFVKIVDQNDTYLVVSEIDNRINHNKARLRKCNQILIKEKPGEYVIIGYNDFGEPIFSTGESTYLSFLSIVENTVLDIETNYPIVISENEIIAILQENEETLLEFKIGEIFSVLNKNYQVFGVDRFKPGLLYIKGRLN